MDNKAAWEEAFEHRHSSWGKDIVSRVNKENYPFFTKDMKELLKKQDLEGKVIGQFCCNNGRELVSIVKSGKAKKGIGIDIAENQIQFANEKAKEIELPCFFVATNIYDIDDNFKEQFDLVIITIGALCWFKYLNRFFKIVANCMKPNAKIYINEQHPFTNMIATNGEESYDLNHPLECKYSYFEHVWKGNEGMFYITKAICIKNIYRLYAFNVRNNYRFMHKWYCDYWYA